MKIRNFLTSRQEDLESCHEGVGILKNVSLFQDADFAGNIRFMNYTILPPGTTIGNHPHGDDEEMYIILEGTGMMSVNGESRKVEAGDVIVNPPYGIHRLVNDSDNDLRILVLEVYK